MMCVVSMSTRRYLSIDSSDGLCLPDMALCALSNGGNARYMTGFSQNVLGVSSPGL